MNAERIPLNPPFQDPDDYTSGASTLHEQIIGAFCHDLRQPLNAALMRLASLQRAYTTGQDRELLEELHLNLREIASMSESVFDAIRLSRASIQPRPVAVSIGDLLARVQSEFLALAENRGLRLRIVPSSYLVVTDEMLLGRILSNLVHNALNYTREGGILVAARRAAGGLSLEVWDTGPGIRADEIDRIFTPFYRGQEERDAPRATSNSGIGLWNGREFARLLGGTLTVHSRPGRGSVFRLHLPVVVETVKRRFPRATPSAESTRCRVALLASDPSVLVHQQRLVLARGDVHVSFSDPLQLLAYLNVPLNRPDVLLIDARVSPVSADFLVGILAVRYPDLPVALVADDVSRPLAESVHRLGVRVLPQPLGADALEAFLREVVGVRPAASLEADLQSAADRRFETAGDAKAPPVEPEAAGAADADSASGDADAPRSPKKGRKPKSPNRAHPPA